MSSFNRVILLGNLTREVEVKYLQSGMVVAEIGLAVNDRRKNQAGEWVEETTFVDVTLWGRTAEVAGEHRAKGSSVLIEGRLKLEQWERDGQKRSKLKVNAERMQMVGNRGGNNGNSEHSGGRSQSRQSRGNAPAGPRANHDGQRAAAPPADEIPF